MRARATAAAALLAALAVTGCGLVDATGPDDDPASDAPLPSSTVSAVPARFGTWEPMPTSPLEPRGGALPLWTGGRLLLLGGYRVVEQTGECPPAADCAGPRTTGFDDGAAWDPATGEWTHLVDPTGREVVLHDQGDGATWSGSAVLTRGTETLPDLAAGTLTTSPLDLGPALVYADPVWTGSRLVGVGWDYGAALSGTEGQLVAEVLDPATGERSAVPWPYLPPESEGARTAWTGSEVVVVTPVVGVEGTSYRTAAFDPASGEWRSVTDEIVDPHAIAWDGRRVLVVSGRRLQALDVVTGAVSTVADLPDGALGSLLVSDSGRVVLHAERDYLLDDGGWLRLPDLPTEVRATGRTLAWAGDDIVVWGGSIAGTVDGGATESTAEGWVFGVSPSWSTPSAASGP